VAAEEAFQALLSRLRAPPPAVGTWVAIEELEPRSAVEPREDPFGGRPDALQLGRAAGWPGERAASTSPRALKRDRPRNVGMVEEVENG